MREKLDALAKAAEKVRIDALFDEGLTGTLNPIAEQHFLLALAALDQAHRFFTLAGHYSRKD